MIGQIIQSYLVSLGVQIDKPGFQQADATIRQTGDNIERVTGGMARNFVKASTIISSAIASVTASAVGLMKATAQEDLAMQKYARTMMMSEDATWKMKKATDALGESINDIALTPELLGRYNKLVADGSQMMVGGDFKETMKNFRDLMFEFTRLKQEASYALNWVGYYLMKYLQRPLADIKEKFKTFNDMVVKNMSVWTEKIARGIYYVLEVGRHFLTFLSDVGRHLKNMWDSFPDGVKKAIVAITALQAVLSAGPLGRTIMLISTLLLLIDDYYGYMEGKDAALGKYWDKLNNFLDTAKKKYEELKATVEPYWEKFIGYAEQAKKWFDELITSIDKWTSSTGAELLQDFIDECKDWWQILNDLYDTIENGVKVTWQTFMEELEKNDTIEDVRVLLERLWRVFVILYDAVKDVIDGIVQLVNEITKTEEWHEFIAVVAELFDGVVELYDAIMDLVQVALEGLFGQFDKKDAVLSFRDVLRAVLKVFTGIIRAVNWVIGLLKDLFKLVAGNKTFKKFWEEVGKEIGNTIGLLGKFGSKLRDLWDEITGKSSSGKGKGKGKGGKAGGGSNEEKLWSMMKADGLTDEGAAAVLGNFLQEDSTLDPSVAEDGSRTFKIDGKTGFGIAQWTEISRQRKLQEMAEKHGMSVHDLTLQYMNFRREAQERGLWEYLKTTHDLREATKRFHDEFEGSDDYNTFGNIEHRQDYARQVLGRNQGKTYFQEEDESEVSPSTGINLRGGKVRIHSSAEGYNAGLDSEVTKTKTMRPRTKEAVNALSLVLPDGLTITGGAEKGYHKEKDEYGNELKYSHIKGYKFDLSFDEIPPGSDAEKTLRKVVEGIYGGKVVQEGDHWDCFVPDGPSKYEEVKNLFNMDTESTASDDVHAAAGWGDNGQPIGISSGASEGNANRELQQRFDDAKGAMRDRGYDFYIQNSTEGSIGFTSPAPDWENIRDVLESYGMSVTHDEHGFYVSLDPNRKNPGLDNYLKYGTADPPSSIWDSIWGGSSGFVDAQTAAELGGLPAAQRGGFGELKDILGNVDTSQLGKVREMILQNKGLFPAEALEDMMELIEEIQTAGKNSGIFDAMRNGMPDYGRTGVSVGGINVRIDVGGVSIHGEGKTNSDIGRDVGNAVVQAAVEYFSNGFLAQTGIIPTAKVKAELG